MIADGGGAQHDLDLALGVRARTGLSGKSALAVDVGPLGAGTGAGVAENGPLKATGFAVGMGRDRNRRRTSGRVLAAHRVGHRCRDPEKDKYRSAPHSVMEPQAGKPRKLCKRRIARLKHRRGQSCRPSKMSQERPSKMPVNLIGSFASNGYHRRSISNRCYQPSDAPAGNIVGWIGEGVHEVGSGRDIENQSRGEFVTRLRGRPSSAP
jgi:hypothetical protein